MRIATQFSIFLINKPGVLAQVTTTLAKAKINLFALTLTDSGEHGVLRIACDDPDAARKALGKVHDRFTETDVLAVEITNEPGAFASAAQKLADAHININYAYCTGGAKGGKTTAIFKVADLKKAWHVLSPAKGAKKDNPATVKRSPKPKR